MIRLDKYLADMGLGTRSELKKAIRQGRVQVDGAPARGPEQKVDEERAAVYFDGEPVDYRRWEYWMLHKPAGVVTATRDPRERTVLDLLSAASRRDLFPVGRLDKDTEGLLLITNDGELAHRLLSPGRHVDKVYEARIRGVVTEAEVQAFREGVDIGDERPTLQAELEILHTADGESQVRITLREGRYHQIKRMFEARGMRVTDLRRLSMGPLTLDESLPPGGFRRLTEEEYRKVRSVTSDVRTDGRSDF